MSGSDRRRSVFAAAAAALAGGLGVAACSSGPTPNGQSASSTTSRPAGSTTTAPSTSTSVATSSTSTTGAPSTTTTSGSTTTPVLGRSGAWAPSGVGFGEARPTEIFLGGDPTGLVTGITWSSWGGTQAVGSGTSTYVASGESVAQGTQTPATVVASDLGTCAGVPAYQQVVWYFPSAGQTAATTDNSVINACTGP